MKYRISHAMMICPRAWRLLLRRRTRAADHFTSSSFKTHFKSTFSCKFHCIFVCSRPCLQFQSLQRHFDHKIGIDIRRGYRDYFGNCARTIFIHELSSIRKHTSERSERVSFLIRFSNSLIVHQVKTKEIMTVTVVWIPDLN